MSKKKQFEISQSKREINRMKARKMNVLLEKQYPIFADYNEMSVQISDHLCHFILNFYHQTNHIQY